MTALVTARGKHRERPRRLRLSLLLPSRQYELDYANELLRNGTLLPSWGPTAPCPHDDWTRTLDVIVRGGDD